MSRKEKIGGRHASAGCDRYVKAAAHDALLALKGVRISFGHVVAVSSKSHSPGSWARRKPADEAGGIPIILYGDAKCVYACVFLAANDNERSD